MSDGPSAASMPGEGKWRPYPNCKDVAVDWLGYIPTHWSVQRLKYFVESCQNGLWGEDPNGKGNDIVCVRVADFDRVKMRVADTNLTVRSVSTPQFNGAQLSVGDLLLEKSGGGDLQPVGFVVLFNHEFRAVCSNFIARMRPSKNTHPNYLTYFFRAVYHARLNYKSIKQTTGIQNLDSPAYLSEHACTPPLVEQEQIALFLDRETAKIDTLITKRQQLIELLEEKRAALISHAVTKGLDPSVPMKESGIDWLGKIPAHWEVKRVKFCVRSLEQGWSPSCDNRQAEGDEWGVLKVGCVNGTSFREDENKALPLGVDPIPELEVKPGDILVSRANTRELLGSAGLIEAVRPRLLLCDKLYRIRVASNVSPTYFVFALRAHPARVQMEMVATGASASMQNIGQDDLRQVVIAVPSLREQQSLVAHFKQVSANIDKLVEAIREAILNLEEFRTTLISAAVTGKIDVRGEVS